MRKFSHLPPKQQHKKAAELLRTYHELVGWIDEDLSNAYHSHLDKAGVSHKEHNLLPSDRDRATGAPFLPITIYLDHLRSAHNVGSIMRTVEAFRLGKIIFSEQTPGLENKQVRDTSMGTWEWVESDRTPLSSLPSPIIALETGPDATPLHEFEFPDSFTLIVGNEEYGISREALELADHIVEIPLCGRKASLNVANSLAIVASEIRKKMSAGR